ncbi:conserved hypothetical protein [Paecilomyces variotii No. 5]|uniref:AtmA protein n=1 Tax=Byssochlamys spectabilis (strain No. 5 / NBRC 109023) TaxID=1356009 RepID=V5I5S3_BYSSN|nr:conserved hypothetical protein [Paecilomyces variotii No. 5]
MATLTSYTLFFFSAFALYSKFYFAFSNGLLELVDKVAADKLIPNVTNEALRTVYTGVPLVDQLFITLGTFFWPTVDGNHPTVTLHTLAFAGAFGSAWVLVLLEGWRKGNAWKIVSFAVIFGIGAQLLTFAVTTPFYCGLHLATASYSVRPNFNAVSVPRSVLLALPVIFAITYFIPSGLMLVPAPEIFTYDQKQIIIALWQPWPVYASFLAAIASVVLPAFISDNSTTASKQAVRQRKALRGVYTFAFALGAIAHIASWTISLSTVLAPAIFSEKYAHDLHPTKVFQATLPWANTDLRVSSVAEGVHLFLQWDFAVGATAILLWAVTLLIRAHRHISGTVCWTGLVVKVAFLWLMAGPIGTAVALIWERDELVIEHELIQGSRDKKTV